MATIEEIRQQNLAFLVAEYGSVAAVAEAIDRSPAQVSQWLNQSKDSKTGKPRGMRSGSARYVEDRCGKSRGWMDEPHASQDTDLITISRFDLSVAAGPGRYLDAQQRVGSMQVCKDIVTRILRQTSATVASLALVTVAGDSMEPTIRDGDIVVIDRSVRAIERDGVYIFTLGNETFLKRLQRMPDSILVNSDNPLYSPWKIQPGQAQELYVHGRVIWGWIGREI
ncbi:MAG: S24 family peptidase [Halothiobacillaceae bacterium]